MKKIFLMLFTLASFSVMAQINISEARAKSIGESVTIQGIVTNSDELGPIRYIQDATGGLPAYSPGNFANAAQPGAVVKVTGVLKDFNGLLELDPVSNFEISSTGNPLPAPRLVTPAQMNESIESQLVKIEGVNFAAGGSSFSTGNYEFTVNGESSTVFVRANHPLIGTQIPLAKVNLTGIVSEFRTDYQLLLRGTADIEIADNFFIATSPVQSNLTPIGFTLRWTTNEPGSTKVKYGLTSALDQEIDLGGATTDHEVVFDNLSPATFYYMQAESQRGNTTARSNVQLYSTASNSTGEIIVYFNKSVDPSFSNGSAPAGTTPAAVEGAIIAKINAAKTSVDVCMYNNDRRPIVNALNDALARGVQVRYVTNIGSFNEALNNPRPNFTVVQGNPDALMHNKFVVVDAGSEDESWLIMGSMNFTNTNTSDDYNNMVFIQDQSLAKAYVREFEEMWGSSGAAPGIFTAKFGPSKTDNTPHLFSVNGIEIESAFSPSDNTTVRIEKALRSADTDLQFATLTFTRNELGTAVKDMHDAGVAVRGMFETSSDQGSEFQYLLDGGVDVRLHTASGSLHHKYAIVDATDTDSDPVVITGSHNWSSSAETSNDENTLIFHDVNLTNIFLQEFEQRWCEEVNPGNCLTGSRDLGFLSGVELVLSPNPAVDNMNVSLKTESPADFQVYLLDVNGKILEARVLKNIQDTVSFNLQTEHYGIGQYFLRLVSDSRQKTVPFSKIR